jgi:hypothetical protein
VAAPTLFVACILYCWWPRSREASLQIARFQAREGCVKTAIPGSIARQAPNKIAGVLCTAYCNLPDSVGVADSLSEFPATPPPLATGSRRLENPLLGRFVATRRCVRAKSVWWATTAEKSDQSAPVGNAERNHGQCARSCGRPAAPAETIPAAERHITRLEPRSRARHPGSTLAVALRRFRGHHEAGAPWQRADE